MQTDSRILDSMARFFTNAAGAAQAFRAEVETIVKTRFERLVSDLDLVPREEFNAVRAMAAKARVENEKLAERVAALEAIVAATGPEAKARAGTRRPRRKTPTTPSRGKL